ncbi:MAG: DUF1015 family protein [Caldimicrobium sp.]
MPKCLPFNGFLYNPEKVKIEDVLAPPYDVVSKEEIASFKQKSPYNIFHLELPEHPEKAKNLLQNFISQKILIKNKGPTLYYYEITFPFEGETYLRRGYILLTKIYDFQEGMILPHEKIYPNVAEERFNLFLTTLCQFSQIFALYEDPNLETLEALPHKLDFYFQVKHNQETHRLAKIHNQNLIQKILTFLENKKFYIADGHHRYITALKLKTHLKNSQTNTLQNIDFNYISIYICPFEEKGLLMLPTHRVFPDKYYLPLINNLEIYSTLEKEVSIKDWEREKKFFKENPQYFFIYRKEKIKIFRFKESFLTSLKEQEFLNLPLHNFLQILENSLKIQEAELKKAEEVEFTGSEKEAIEKANKKGFAVLFPKSPIKLLKEIAKKGKIMPHKATYFYPKILTGAVIYKFDET